MLARLFKRRLADPATLLKSALGEFELPTFQTQTMMTLKLLRDPDAGWMALGRSIEANPGLVAKTLRTVNSASFGLRQQISSVTHAVGLLGRARLESLVLAFVVAGKLPTRAANAAGLDVPRFWRAASLRASVARSLAELIEPQAQSEAFVGGLLQDMAVPLLAAAQGKRYQPVVECWQETAESLEGLEQSEFGWDHSDVGSCIADKWEFPAALRAAIEDHHDGAESAGPPRSTQLVSLLEGHGETEDSGLDELIAAARQTHPVCPDRLVRSVRDGVEKADELTKLLMKGR